MAVRGTEMTQAEAVTAWVASSEARTQATRELARLGTPDVAVAADDLIQDVAIKTLQQLERGPIVESGGGLAGYLTTALRNRAIDVYRGARVRPGVSTPTSPDDLGSMSTGESPVELDVVGGEAVDEVRSRLAGNAETAEPWALSGALTAVTFASEPGLSEHLRWPSPQNRGLQEQMLWAGLGYAGCSDLLPGDGRDDDSARRKRRSRHMTKVKALLATAGDALIGGDR